MSKRGGTDAVDDFLELEEELSSGTKTAKTYDEGNIAGVAKLSANEVPDDYPVPIRTRRALQLNVETPDGETVATYLEWPGDGEDSETKRASNTSDHVEKLLDALGRDRDEFANVYGDRVALDSEDGWHGIDAEKTAALRGAKLAAGDDSLDQSRNLVAGALAAGLLTIPVAALSEVVAGLFMMVAWVGIPVAIYLDGKRLDDAGGWTPKTKRWILGTLLPLLNYPVAIAYLLDRHVRLSGATSDEGSKLWYKSIFACFLSLPVALFVGSVASATGGLILFLGWSFLPFAVYFDAEYVEDATDWDPSEEWWTVATILLGLVGAAAYLTKRYVELD